MDWGILQPACHWLLVTRIFTVVQSALFEQTHDDDDDDVNCVVLQQLCSSATSHRSSMLLWLAHHLWYLASFWLVNEHICMLSGCLVFTSISLELHVQSSPNCVMQSIAVALFSGGIAILCTSGFMDASYWLCFYAPHRRGASRPARRAAPWPCHQSCADCRSICTRT